MYSQAECRENAMRDRHQTGDWYSHSSPGAGAPSLSASAAGVRSSPVKKMSQESEAWFDYSHSPGRNGAYSPASSTTGPGKQDVNQNWFRHDNAAGANGSSPRQQRDMYPIGVSVPKVKPRRSNDERLAREAAAGDPNAWFRHDHQGLVPSQTSSERPGSAGNSGSKKRMPAKTAQEPLWFAQNGREHSGTSAANVPSTSKTRHSGPDADLYYQRDKTGSGAEWFPHLHPSSNGGSEEHQPDAGPASSRGGNNRMNAESPAWFSHDDPPAAASPRPAASPEVRKMQARATGDEVRQILRVNENLHQQQNDSSIVEAEHRSAPGGVPAAGVSNLHQAASHDDTGYGMGDHGTDSLVEKFHREVALSADSVDD